MTSRIGPSASPTILDELEPEQWSLTMIRDGGADGVYTFTVAGLASYAVHEAHHHLLDADGTLPPTITPLQAKRQRSTT